MESQSPAWAAALFLSGFFVVMLIVPWIMGRDPSVQDTPLPGPTPRFTSRRERRLWLSTVAALAVIYSKMGLMPELSAILREGNLLGLSSTAALLYSGRGHRTVVGEDTSGPPRDWSCARRGIECKSQSKNQRSI